MLPTAALYNQLAQASAFNDPVTAALVANSMPVVSQSQDSSQSTTPTGSRDTMLTKIFVGGLPYHTTDMTLHEYFKQFGEIEEAVVITDRQTQKSRGYGFVTMKEKADAEKACKDPNPIIDGRKANVNLAFLGAKPRNNVNLSTLTTGLATIPFQQQLAALIPGRMGMPQLYYPAASVAPTAGNGLLNPLAAQLNPPTRRSSTTSSGLTGRSGSSDSTTTANRSSGRSRRSTTTNGRWKRQLLCSNSKCISCSTITTECY
ncbi:hypothetical protein M3Y94_00716200 [Aphelenchoides besseyi]|nr:hypothetical protein M3Y94_00716200 [Aphelenchoides besseyi]